MTSTRECVSSWPKGWLGSQGQNDHLALSDINGWGYKVGKGRYNGMARMVWMVWMVWIVWMVWMYGWYGCYGWYGWLGYSGQTGQLTLNDISSEDKSRPGT